jgi:hypothetical protein
MIATAGTAFVKIIATDGEHTHIDEATLSEVELAFLVSPVLREDAKRLVPPNGWVTAHRLIVHGNAAVHATARN